VPGAAGSSGRGRRDNWTARSTDDISALSVTPDSTGSLVAGSKCSDLGAYREAKGDQVRMSKVKVIIAAFVAVLALSALASASASAATAGWLVNGTLLTGTQTAALATTAAVDQNGVLKFKGITVTCTGTTLNGVTPLIEASGNKGSAGSLGFTGCSGGGENCTLALADSSIGTLPVVTGEVTLEGTLGVQATFKAKTGTLFTTLKFEGASCAIASEVQPVKGTAHATGPTGQDSNVLQLLSVNATSASEELKVGSSAASLIGSALLKLASSLPWSFM